MKRFSRSDSSMIVPSNSALDPGWQDIFEIAQGARRPSTDESGVRRSWLIEVSRACRRRSVSAARSARSRSSTRRTRSIARAPISTRASRSRLSSGVRIGPVPSVSRPTTPSVPRPVRMGMNSRRAPGAYRRLVLPGGRCRRPSGQRRDRLRPAGPRGGTGADGHGVTLGQEQDGPDLQHGRDLRAGRPEHIVQRAASGELPREAVEPLRRPRSRLADQRRQTRAARRFETSTATMVNSTKAATFRRIGDGEV